MIFRQGYGFNNKKKSRTTIRKEKKIWPIRTIKLNNTVVFKIFRTLTSLFFFELNRVLVGGKSNKGFTRIGELVDLFNEYFEDS